MSHLSPSLQAIRLLAEAWHHLLASPDDGPESAARRLEALGRVHGLPPEIGVEAAALARRCRALRTAPGEIPENPDAATAAEEPHEATLRKQAPCVRASAC